MPLDPDKLRQVTEKSETLSRRFDEFMERRKINDSADEDEDEDELFEPAEEAMRATPGSDLANPDLDEPRFNKEARQCLIRQN
jgi:hypothetical protein